MRWAIVGLGLVNIVFLALPTEFRRYAGLIAALCGAGIGLSLWRREDGFGALALRALFGAIAGVCVFLPAALITGAPRSGGGVSEEEVCWGSHGPIDC